MRFFSFAYAAVLGLAALASACASIPRTASDALNAPDLAGTRWGLVVMTMDGRELASLRPDERFTPASNTKLFTVAAAFHRLPLLGFPDPSSGASVRIEPRDDGPPDIALVGGGDAMLIDADNCERDCLSELADSVLAAAISPIHDVIGDDRLFPDQRWGDGWAQEDLLFRSGAPASALVVNSNEVVLEVTPGAAPGDPVKVQWRADDQYFALQNEAVTVEGDQDRLRIERLPGATTVRVYGTQGVGVRPQSIPVAVEDPALTAAWRFKRLLQERGLVIEGTIRARHRPLALTDAPGTRGDGAAIPELVGREIARLSPPPLAEDIRFLTKQSQNLHAEVLLRRLGRIEGSGSAEDGLAIVAAMLAEAGADRRAWDFSDGSGMSAYNRVTPRMVARFLLWASKQSWAEAFRAALPVGGGEGTLSRRFRGTPLEGRIFAKTGTFSSVNALSGFMLTKSGKTLIFSAFANDQPEDAGSATKALDSALNAIAAAH